MHVGVDEAGKGPVVGSMFAAAVRADPAALPDDITDSKQLSQPRREELATTIRTVSDSVAVAEVSVDRIDDPETNMNELTVTAQAEALSQIAVDGDAGYLDAGDTNAVRFERRVGENVPQDVELRAEHRADETYRIVGAASIIAKVAREAHVQALAAQYGEIGSGYPSDETTRQFLHEFVNSYGELPSCARASWQTSKDILAAQDQLSLTSFE